MKDMGEADVILGIRIKHESNGIAISQSHYIEKVLKKFNYSDCTPVSTPLDTCENLMPNRGLTTVCNMSPDLWKLNLSKHVSVQVDLPYPQFYEEGKSRIEFSRNHIFPLQFAICGFVTILCRTFLLHKTEDMANPPARSHACSDSTSTSQDSHCRQSVIMIEQKRNDSSEQ
nr:zinc finger, CCHC-type [Tanacetum cinerariifolium]